MKPFHYHTPYFKLGTFRVQCSIVHINGPHWTGESSGLDNTFVWRPEYIHYKQEYRGFVTVSRGILFGMLFIAIDICDVRVKSP